MTGQLRKATDEGGELGPFPGAPWSLVGFGLKLLNCDQRTMAGSPREYLDYADECAPVASQIVERLGSGRKFPIWPLQAES